MAIIDTTTAGEAYLDGRELESITEVSTGRVIWQKPDPFAGLTFTNMSTTNEVAQISYTNNGGNAPDLKISRNGGLTWESWPADTVGYLQPGQTVCLKGNNPAGWSSSDTVYSKFNMTNGSIALGGNINSLLDNGDGSSIVSIPSDSCYLKLFLNCSSITSINGNLLPCLNLTRKCYMYLFNNCTGITELPEGLLPATTLTSQCYADLVAGCTNLKTVPSNLLPATEIKSYHYMFSGCSSLTTVPDLSHVTTVGNTGMTNMFAGCSSLKQLPTNMFESITSTETYALRRVFYNCSSLKVKENSGTDDKKIFTCKGNSSIYEEMFTGTAGTFKSTPTTGNSYYWYE